MTNLPVNAFANLILQFLPADERFYLERHLEIIELRRGEIIYQSGEAVKNIYFPESAIFSGRTVFSNGHTIETSIVGFDGVVGACNALSALPSACETVVQISGRAYRMPIESFGAALRKFPFFNRSIHQYIFNLMEQIAQIGACNGSHKIDNRLPTLLLLYSDRIAGNVVRLTHEEIAHLLGAQRQSASVNAKELKDAGIIDYFRGGIKILDRARLENCACECYGSLKRQHENYVSFLEQKVSLKIFNQAEYENWYPKIQSEFQVVSV